MIWTKQEPAIFLRFLPRYGNWLNIAVARCQRYAADSGCSCSWNSQIDYWNGFYLLGGIDVGVVVSLKRFKVRERKFEIYVWAWWDSVASAGPVAGLFRPVLA